MYESKWTPELCLGWASWLTAVERINECDASFGLAETNCRVVNTRGFRPDPLPLRDA